jgi:hypothetical protein
MPTRRWKAAEGGTGTGRRFGSVRAQLDTNERNRPPTVISLAVRVHFVPCHARFTLNYGISGTLPSQAKVSAPQTSNEKVDCFNPVQTLQTKNKNKKAKLTGAPSREA